MDKRVTTPDGVTWEVRRLSPLDKSKPGTADVVVEQNDFIGFEALFMILLSVTLVLVSPLIIQSDRWWLALVIPPLVLVTWFMYVAKWHVLMLREGAVLHHTYVRGRRPAAVLVGELADEIARTPDKKLHP